MIALPILFHVIMWFGHSQSYSGICGPHATDIPAHPCTYEEHMHEFAAGFAGVALFMIEGAIFAGAATLACVVWIVVYFLRRRSANARPA